MDKEQRFDTIITGIDWLRNEYIKQVKIYNDITHPSLFHEMLIANSFWMSEVEPLADTLNRVIDNEYIQIVFYVNSRSGDGSTEDEQKAIEDYNEQLNNRPLRSQIYA